MKKENFDRIDYKTSPKVLEVKDLRINFKSDTGTVHAVRGVSFDLYKGETLCIVGESGSGKSVTSKTIMGILPVNAIIESGQIIYNGEDLIRVSEEEFHRIRGHKIGMIFQDPLSSLNPIMRVGKQIIEATMINKNILKRRYNELISKELVVSRNEEANLAFEKKQANDEIKTLKSLLKKYKTALNIDAKAGNNEASTKALEEINHLFGNLASSSEFLMNGTNSQIKTIEEAPKDTRIELNNAINELRIENLKHKNEYYESCKSFELNRDVEVMINERISMIKEYIRVVKDDYRIIKPHLKKALNESKKIASVDNKKYADELLKERDEKLSILNDRLNIITPEYQQALDELSQEEKELFLRMTKGDKKNVLQKIFTKEDTTTGIAKASQSEEKITSTGNARFDDLYQKREQILAEIEKVKEDYINKTKITKKEAKRIALEVMKEVGIPLPERRFKQYPFEFSGGMRQRIVIAIALTANPDILICDEPTTALDVTIQAQILELINKLKRERGLSCIFITHDLGVVANMADRVAVMYAGKIVEYGTSYEVFFEPKHPYTWALLSSIPDIDSKERLESIPGTPPDMRFPPKGDAFALRSKYAMNIDFEHEPPYFEISPTHYAATWLLHPDAPSVEMPAIVKTRIENAIKGGTKKCLTKKK